VSLPLAGRTVVVTRQPDDARSLAAALEELGARALVVPCTRTVVADDLAAWNEALACLDEIDCVVMTSRRAVEHFVALSDAADLERSAWRDKTIAAVGGATARALDGAGLPASVVGTAGADALADALLAEGAVAVGSRVLFPCSKSARPELPARLEAAGVRVDRAPIYDTLPATPDAAAPLRAELERGDPVDAITFASPSSVAGFRTLLGADADELLRSGRPRIVTIGATTGAAVRDAGFEVAAQATRPAPAAIAAAVVGALK